MKQFTFAALAGVAVANQTLTAEGVDVGFPTATLGADLSTETAMGEQQWEGETDGTTVLQISLWFFWATAYVNGDFEEDWLIQNFVSWEDPINPGREGGVSCNIEYKEENGPADASTVHVLNYMDMDNVSEQLGSGQWWQVSPTESWETKMSLLTFAADFAQTDGYMQTYDSGDYSTQNCLVQITTQLLYDQEPADEDLNQFYWALKNSPGVDFTTGTKVYEQGGSSAMWSTDTQTTTYVFHDFGLENPDDELIIPDEDEDMGESGAAALASAAAVALVTFLLF